MLLVTRNWTELTIVIYTTLHSTIRHAKVEKENCVRTEVLRPEGPMAEVRVQKGGERSLRFLGRGNKAPPAS